MAELGKKANRKKGKSFIQRAKKFGKQGQRGKGTEIDQDQYDYLVRVMERWRDGFDSGDEKRIFVENVFEQTEAEERKLCGNQLASRVIELLLPSAEKKVRQRFCLALGTDLRLVCMDPFMSHVLEKLLLLLSFHESECSDEYDLVDQEWILKVCRFVVNNLEDFCNDVYASHLLRTCIQCLAGARSQSQGGVQRTEGYDKLVAWKFKEKEVEFAEVLETLASRIFSLNAESVFGDICAHVLLMFLEVTNLSSPKLARSVAKHILTFFDSEEGIDWDHVPSVRLLEGVVKVGINSSKLSNKIFSKILDGQLLKLAVHPVGNFIIQRVFENIDDKEKFSTICSEILNKAESILSTGCTGVLLSLIKACLRLEVQQAPALVSLTDALHCTEEQEKLVPCLVHMVTRDAMSEQKVFPVHLHGSLILQQMLQFGKPIKLVRSLLAMTPQDLQVLLGDPRGCHIADSFMTSKTVGEKSRDGIVKALKGQFVNLACNKHGSRTMDTLWNHSGLKQRQTIVEELSTKLDILNSNKFGKFVVQRFYVPIFRRSRDDWKDVVEKKNKVGDMFADIIGEVKPTSKRKFEKSEIPEDEKVTTGNKVDEKQNITDMVDQWIKDDQPQPKKKKIKAKSYLDDL